MAVNLSPVSPSRLRGGGNSGVRDRQGHHGQGHPGSGQEHDVDRPAADGEEAHPPHRQQGAQHGRTDQRQPHDHEPTPPVLEGDQEQPHGHRHQDDEQWQLPEQPREERPADVERRPGHQAENALTGAERSAASTTFCSSIARVIGPTPPGLGATCPATSTTSSATSPAILPSTRLTPTSRTAAPGLTMSAVISPGTPAAATTMSAFLTCAARF